MDVCVQKGVWIMRSDFSFGFKTMLESLQMMQKNLPKMFPIPPEAKNNQFLVYTSNDSSEEIEKSADAIRCYVDFPFIIYYFSILEDFKFNVHYMHTPYQELYEFFLNDSNENPWKLISKKPKQSSSFDELLPSQITDRDHIYLPENEEGFERVTHRKRGKKSKQRCSFGELLPSQVTDRDQIHLPANEEEFERVTHGKGGKWMVHCSNLETLDKFWKLLKPLYDSGILVGLKSSTAKSPVYKLSPLYRTKALMCYTADLDCKSSVGIAAEMISKCIRYKNIMYYKSNEASVSGKYRHEGYTEFSKYMYTDTGRLFERDYLKRWKAVFVQ